MQAKLLKILFLIVSVGIMGCNETKDDNAIVEIDSLPSVSVSKKIISKIETTDVISIQSSPMTLLFAYYTANGKTHDGNLRWYISATSGSLAGYIFSLGDIETINGVEKVSWREVSHSAANVDLIQEKVTIANIADNPTHQFKDWGLGVDKNYESIQEDIELIRNSNVIVRWWFFQAPNGGWFIIDKAKHIYKFDIKNGKYDWQQVDTSTFSMEFYMEGGAKKIRVVPSSVTPIIEGTPKLTTQQYDVYQFLPLASDPNNDTLTFSIENKPLWAEFNSTTGLLSGTPTMEGNYSNIIISVTDGSRTVSLSPFNVEIQSAKNIAHLFGKATQPPKNSYYYYAEPSLAIDGNLSTNNHTQCISPDNWLQIELPNKTKVHKIVLHNVTGQQARLSGSTVYVSNQNYTGSENLNINESLVTLNANMIQTIEINNVTENQYLLIKGNPQGDNSCLHLREVEVYGETPASPIWKSENFKLGLNTYSSVGTVVGKVEALDYQSDLLSYRIIGNVPFSIDSQGVIRLTQTINHNLTQSYTFQVEASDGVNNITTDVSVNLLNRNGVKQERWNNISGTAVSNLLNHPHYQDTPDESMIVSGLNMATINLADDFGQKMTTLFKPEESGLYTFAIAGDDGTELRLDGEKIAHKTSYTSYQNWSLAGKSEEMSLEAGRIYTITALLKESGGAEHISVGIKKDTESDFTLIPLSQLFLEVLDSENIKPSFVDDNVTVSIDKWQNKTEIILNKKAIDSQGDTLTYTLENTTAFSIDTQGDIRVISTLTAGTKTFVVKVSDGTFTIQKTITVRVLDTPITPESTRVMDSSPTLNGYLPNNYHTGSTISIVINGNTYTPRIEGDKWYIDANIIAPALTPNSYDVKVVVDGDEILYSNYFTVDGLLVKSVSKTMVLPSISDVAVTVQSYIETALLKDERVTGTSIVLRVESNGTLVLENKSYREFSSLIGEYNDSVTGEKLLVRLQFNQNILPYTSNILEDFTHASEMSIYPTANMFDGHLSFGGEDCDANTDTTTTHYCVPTSSLNQETFSIHSTGNNEQKIYSTLWATYNHLYNSIDGFNSLKAWVEQGSYKNADLSDGYQSSEFYIKNSGQTATDYLNEKFFGIVMPNKSANMRSMRYFYAAEGMAGLPWSKPLTYRGEIGSWASLWEGSIRLENHVSAYEYVQHEVFHSFSYPHDSGMTYGWSHGLIQVINAFYTIGQNPVVEAPKYLFTSKVLPDNKIQLTLHKTAEATDNEMHFELFSATKLLNDDVTFMTMASDGDNQVTIEYKPNTFDRVFVRVYGSDSKELMSQFFEF